MEWSDAVKGAIVVAVTLIIVAILIALPVMLLWNWVMPEVFGLTTLTFKQALCLALLSKCLFWTGVDTGKKK